MAVILYVPVVSVVHEITSFPLLSITANSAPGNGELLSSYFIIVISVGILVMFCVVVWSFWTTTFILLDFL